MTKLNISSGEGKRGKGIVGFEAVIKRVHSGAKDTVFVNESDLDLKRKKQHGNILTLSNVKD